MNLPGRAVLARPSGGACEGRRKRAAGGGPQPEPGVNPRRKRRGHGIPGEPRVGSEDFHLRESPEFIRGRTSRHLPCGRHPLRGRRALPGRRATGVLAWCDGRVEVLVEEVKARMKLEATLRKLAS